MSTISQNTIHSLSNNAGTVNGAIYALYCNFPATANVVERNLVHSLSITSTNFASQLAGILPVAGSATYQNNMVRLGLDATGASITGGYNIFGMFEIAGTNNLYFNSVYIGGTGVASSSNTFAFASNVTTGTRIYEDNIFWNARSNASGTASNFAIVTNRADRRDFQLQRSVCYWSWWLRGSAPGVTGCTLADWQTGTGQDANSISVDPLFINPNGNAVTGDIHIFPASPCVGAGLTIAGITNDFDGDARLNPPAIGADQPAGVATQRQAQLQQQRPLAQRRQRPRLAQ